MSFHSFHNVNDNFNSLFENFFNIGKFSLDIGTDRINISANHTVLTKSLEIEGTNKFSLEKYNVNLKTTFSSKNTLQCETEIKDFILSNSSQKFQLQQDFISGQRQAILKYGKSGEQFNVGSEIMFMTDLLSPVIDVHTLFGSNNYFLGGQLKLDMHEKKQAAVTAKKLCMGYSVADFTFHGALDFGNSTNYEASIFQRVNDRLKLGFKVGWDKNTSDVDVGLCGRMELKENNGSFIKFRTMRLNTLSLAYGFDFMKGVGIALSGSYSHNDGKVDLGLSVSLATD